MSGPASPANSDGGVVREDVFFTVARADHYKPKANQGGRTAMLAAIALAAALFQEQAGTSPAIPLPAPFDYVEVLDWNFVGITSSDAAVFVRPHSQRGQVWTRHEYLTPRDGVTRSTSSLLELDCTDWKVRVLEGAAFDAPNLQGASPSQQRPFGRDGPSQWEIAERGTLSDWFLNYGCSL